MWRNRSMKAGCEIKVKLPAMHMVRQNYVVRPEIEAVAAVDTEWVRIKDGLNVKKGDEIAVCAGSRGIANIDKVVIRVVELLKDIGCKPFVTPTMGSHGGATPEGQIEVLKWRGITEESVGCPIRATMKVVPMGEENGIPLFLDKLAHDASGMVLINRVKPHTNFVGATESGIIKMMAIGLGNQKGAEHYHKLSLVRPQYEILSTAGKALIAKANFLFGVCLVENQLHQTSDLRMGVKDDMEEVESKLLSIARNALPKLPLDEVDVLIVDEMGKDISGEGIDPNVVGRDVCAYGAERPLPAVCRIFVRDLTEATEGSAIGIGQADFTTQRLVDKIDFEATAINSLTACCPEAGKIPLTYKTDLEALAAAWMTLRPCNAVDVRAVWIKNTLELENLMVSPGCLPFLHETANLDVADEAAPLPFDGKGDLISPFYG